MMPPSPQGTVQEQLVRQYSYLFQMAQQLNVALGQLESGGTAAPSGGTAAPAAREQPHGARNQFAARERGIRPARRAGPPAARASRRPRRAAPAMPRRREGEIAVPESLGARRTLQMAGRSTTGGRCSCVHG